MSRHIVHLISHDLRVHCELDRLIIHNQSSNTRNVVPLQDIAIIIAASPQLSLTAASLRKMVQSGVLLLICDERFEPVCLNMPYYRSTDTHLLRKQVTWTATWRRNQWQQIIRTKIQHQSKVILPIAKQISTELQAIAEHCSSECHEPASINLSQVTASKRMGLHATSPEACESRAARKYWSHFMPVVSALQGSHEKGRIPMTRDGVNGMLDYGYAIVRTAVLRSLAAHGFMAALGIAHSAKAGSFALADDLMEPLRPFVDNTLWFFLQSGPKNMKEWGHEAASTLTKTVTMGKAKIRLINAIDLYIQSFADATLHDSINSLRIPPLPIVNA